MGFAGTMLPATHSSVVLFLAPRHMFRHRRDRARLFNSGTWSLGSESEISMGFSILSRFSFSAGAASVENDTTFSTWLLTKTILCARGKLDQTSCRAWKKK